MSKKYIRPEEASQLLKVSVGTLIRWDKEGKLNCIRTKGNHRRYLYSDIISVKEGDNKLKRKICYCRVSTASQKEDLERQVIYFRDKYPEHEIVKDIGSGINFKRKGFNSILDSAIKGDISEVVVTYRDRLCRFGFELVQRIIEERKGRIVVLNQKETSPEEELVNDLISIVTVFSSRLYGLRSHSIKRQLVENAKDKTLSDGEGEREDTDYVGAVSVVL